MRCTIRGLAVALLTAFMTETVWAQTGQPPASPGATKARPAGRKSVAEEDVAIALAGEVSRHFNQARADLFEEDNIGAANELIKGAALLKLEADHSDGQAKAALMASVGDLDMLAFDIETGGGVGVLDLDPVFARAEAALANAHSQQAKATWGKKDAKNTGLHLKATTVALKNGWRWSGKKLDAGTQTVVKDVDAVANKLVGGGQWTEEEVKGALDKVGTEAGKLTNQTKK